MIEKNSSSQVEEKWNENNILFSVIRKKEPKDL